MLHQKETDPWVVRLLFRRKTTSVVSDFENVMLTGRTNVNLNSGGICMPDRIVQRQFCDSIPNIADLQRNSHSGVVIQSNYYGLADGTEATDEPVQGTVEAGSFDDRRIEIVA